MTRIEELETRIRSLGSCVVAFSGGVDSSLVAALAARALGERALAVTAVSPALATGELDGARDVALRDRHPPRDDHDRRARARGISRERPRPLLPLQDRSSTTGSAPSRRGGLRGGALRSQRRRPRRLAARAHARPPSTLSSIRCSRPASARTRSAQLARELGVPSAEKPASPCLASRIPYGTAVDPVGARADRSCRARGEGARLPRAAGAPLRRRSAGSSSRRTSSTRSPAERREAIVAGGCGRRATPRSRSPTSRSARARSTRRSRSASRSRPRRTRASAASISPRSGRRSRARETPR